MIPNVFTVTKEMIKTGHADFWLRRGNLWNGAKVEKGRDHGNFPEESVRGH